MLTRKRIFTAAAVVGVFTVLLLTLSMFTAKKTVTMVPTLDSQMYMATKTDTPVQYPLEMSTYGFASITPKTEEEFLDAVKRRQATMENWVMWNPSTKRAAAAFRTGITTDIISAPIVSENPQMALAATGAPVRAVTSAPPVFAEKPSTKSGFRLDPSSPWVMFGFPILLMAGMVTCIWWLQRRQMAGSAKFTEAAVDPSAPPPTRFTDVAGCVEAVEDMQEIVDILKHPDFYTQMGVTVPKGALLVGPPGTGKTLLARAVAGEAGVPFYTASGSDFVEMFVGVGAGRIRNLFKKARKHEGGAIIFIDEIDAIGKARHGGGDAAGASHEQESTLNALLVEMDGFTGSNIIVLGATNRSDILDPALTRPGRLDRRVVVGLPDRMGREQILHRHIASKNLTADATVDVSRVAKRTPGMSGAELARIVNEAALNAARERRGILEVLDFDHAVATVAMGKPRESALVTDSDRLTTAWHEAGHTVAAMVLPDADDPVSVSIIPRGDAGGITWMSGNDDIFMTRRQAHARLVVSMAGRAAEEVLLDGEFTSGPSGDLQAATQLAFAMVTRFGMTDTLVSRGDVAMEQAFALDAELRGVCDKLIRDALIEARNVLQEHETLLSRIVTDLLEYNTLTHQQLDAIRAGV